MKEKIIDAANDVFDGILKGVLSIAGIMIIILFGMLIALYIANSMQINENSIGLLSISFSILLVFITAFYVYLTSENVSLTKNYNKIAFAEKRLEKLYYPLRDFLNSRIMVTCSEEQIVALGNYGNIDESRYKIEDIYPFQYLATKNLNGPLHEYIEMIRELKSLEMTERQIKELHTKVRTNVDTDIEYLIEELTKLVKSS